MEENEGLTDFEALCMYRNRIERTIKLLEMYNLFCNDNVLKCAINILKGTEEDDDDDERNNF